MEKQQKKKKQFKDPEVIDLRADAQVAYLFDCDPAGGSDTATCNATGTSAGGTCLQNGETALGECANAGESASSYTCTLMGQGV